MLAGVLAGFLAAPTGAQEAQEVDFVVEAPRQVSDDPDPVRLMVNPQVAVAPDDPSTVVVTVAEARNGGCGLRVSRDGGLSWVTTTENLLPEPEQFCVHRNSGPVMPIQFASDGTLYVGMSASSSQTEPPHPNGPITALVATSDDLGRSHETFTVAEPEGFRFTPPDGGEELEGYYQWRLPSLAVDPNDPDKLYMGWRLWNDGIDGVSFRAFPQRSYISTSDDGGRTWTEPVDVLRETLEDRADELGLVFEGEEVTHSETPMLVVGPDSTVYAFTKESPVRGPQGAPDPPARHFMFKSADGGATWETSIISEGAQNIGNPSVAVDGESGDLYLVYASRGADVGEDEPANPSEIYFTSSTDGGQTWSEPVNITDDDPSRSANQYFPGISVAPDGRIDIAWYDFRNDPFFSPGESGGMGTSVGEQFWDVYYTTSHDGGLTWSENARVTNPSIDGELGVTFNNMDVRGPMGIASTDHAAYVAWSDSRPTAPGGQDAEDAYFSRIRFAAPPALGSNAGQSNVAWAGLGAGGALLVGGLALVAASRSRKATARR